MGRRWAPATTSFKCKAPSPLAGTLLVSSVYTPTHGDTFTIIDNDGTDPVVGTFTGLAEGAYFTVGIDTYKISYAGGTDNNDVV